MRRAIRWTFKAVALASLLSPVACALFAERPGVPTDFGPREQIYHASFEEVWKAVSLVLQPYPLRVSNMDQGVIETDALRGDRIWQPPFAKGASIAGQSYKLSLRVVRGAQETRPATKVTILKNIQVQVDFFSDPKPLASDGMEEKSILYRIRREIQIERALARAQKKYNEKHQ
jgi:hypothetical protein